MSNRMTLTELDEALEITKLAKCETCRKGFPLRELVEEKKAFQGVPKQYLDRDYFICKNCLFIKIKEREWKLTLPSFYVCMQK